MEKVASEFLRAVRGSRSQVQLSRRLGYRGNPVADWEAGRRFPTAAEALRACTRSRIDAKAALEVFSPGSTQDVSDLDDEGVARWLRALRRNVPLVDLARRTGRSRFAVSRWLSGRTRPRVPDFFLLVDAMTGRLPELVAELVPIEEVEALRPAYDRLDASKRLAFEEPWIQAILPILETEAYRSAPHEPGFIARVLGIPVEVERRCLAKLELAGIIGLEAGRYVTGGELTVDTRAHPDAMRIIKTQWTQVAEERIADPSSGDMFGYYVFAVSQADLERIRVLHRAYFRQVRTIVSASSPSQTVALVNLQLMSWDVEGGDESS